MVQIAAQYPIVVDDDDASKVVELPIDAFPIVMFVANSGGSGEKMNDGLVIIATPLNINTDISAR